jgi:hypothetical protein
MKDMQDTQVSIPVDSQQLLMLSDKVLGNGELLDDDDNEEEDEEESAEKYCVQDEPSVDSCQGDEGNADMWAKQDAGRGACQHLDQATAAPSHAQNE